MANNILKEFWHGLIIPNEQAQANSPRAQHLKKLTSTIEQELQATFTPEQAALFEKYDRHQANLASIWEEEIFIYGFKLGLNMAMESTK